MCIGLYFSSVTYTWAFFLFFSSVKHKITLQFDDRVLKHSKLQSKQLPNELNRREYLEISREVSLRDSNYFNIKAKLFL